MFSVVKSLGSSSTTLQYSLIAAGILPISRCFSAARRVFTFSKAMFGEFRGMKFFGDDDCRSPQEDCRAQFSPLGAERHLQTNTHRESCQRCCAVANCDKFAKNQAGFVKLRLQNSCASGQTTNSRTKIKPGQRRGNNPALASQVRDRRARCGDSSAPVV